MPGIATENALCPALKLSGVAARLAAAGAPFSREQIHRVAHQAHGDASATEGARGSGADVAASVWGGVIEVIANPNAAEPTNVRALSDAGHYWVAVDAGAPANTRRLVSAVRAFAASENSRYRSHMGPIGTAALRGIEAIDSGQPRDLIRAFEDGFGALADLGKACSLDLVTTAHRQISKSAQNHGGAAKPTGAGGGDTALAVFEDEASARRFCADLVSSGIQPLHLCVDQDGVIVFPATTG